MHQSSADPILASNLRIALEKSGRSAYAVAIAINHAPNWLYRVVNGKTGILIPTLREVAAELGVSAGSLLDSPNGNGHGLVSELEDAGALSNGNGASAGESGLSRVPLTRGASSVAGSGINTDGEYIADYVPFRDDWLQNHNLNPDGCQVIEVSGESMEPTLEHRSVILVDFQRTTRRQHKIFAVLTEDGPVVKRLRRNDDGWRLVSDNEDKDRYPTVPWPPDAIVRGQVMWTGKTL